MTPARELFDAACLRAIDRVGGTHEQGAGAVAWRIPADRIDDFVAALVDELDDAWHVRWAHEQSTGMLYVEHTRPVGITHLRFVTSPVLGPPMQDLVCTHYY